MTDLSIIPLPLKAVLTDGIFRLNRDTPIIADTAALPEAHYLADALKPLLGADLVLKTDDTDPAQGIHLHLNADCQPIGNEGYRLTITPSKVTLKAAASPGLFYGIQTLLQLLPVGQQVTECSLPCAEIEDSPRFGWRGAMLDVSRHFFPKEFVLKFIDLIAMHKMNVLHLHLTDDQGWRIEIKKYPLLTSVGSMRDQTMVGRAFVSPADDGFDPASQIFDGIPHSGYYTQEDAREIVAYAASRHIMVMPEIEMPGHAQSAIAAYPFLGCGDEAMEVSASWGIHDAIYKPSEQTFEFLRDVLTEVMEIFPSRFIHVGGDEAIKTRWRTDPDTQALKNSLGLRDEEAIQSYFIGKMDEFLAQQGRILVGWDEILEGGLSPGAVVMSWRGEEGGVEAAKQGHDVIMAPNQYTYFDHYQSEDRESEPLAFSEFLPLSRVYSYEPIPAELPKEFASRVLGAQGQLWSEYIPSTRQVEYQAFPRLAALAEVIWSSRENKDYPGFLARLRQHETRLDALEVNYRPLQTP